ncbi:MAG: leucine-rich repeat protein [Clostridia bacterium]|nr:leucine-rich repeat protein [Clostridia bacterium]
MKKQISIVLAIIMLLSALPLTGVSSFAYTSGDWEYTVYDGAGVITGYTGKSSNPTIPLKLGGYTIEEIGSGAFLYNNKITGIIIPDSVNYIGPFAFEGSGLKSITIPSTVKSIGYSAFANCVSLTSVSIPVGLKRISDGMFAYCSALKSIIIPNGAEQICGQAFEGCVSLKSVSLPETLQVINGTAFNGCSSLVSITIPSSVKTIEKGAFKQCSSLKNVTVYYNPQSSFAQDFAEIVTNVIIPEGTREIEDMAFYRYIFLKNITIPTSVTRIGDRAFEYCVRLKGIYIPESVTEIGDYAYGYYHDYNQPFYRINGGEVIAGKKGSEAERYAKANDIPFYVTGTYPDVAEDSWYYEAVKYVGEKGYITGYSNCRFGPGDALKRQDFVVVLARVAGADLTEYENVQSKLSDVRKGEYYAAAVNWAVDNGIISGYQNGRFGVGDNITREQVATILYRYMGSPTVSGADKTLAKFKDYKNISPFAKTAVAWAVQNGIISGMADGRVAPVEGASRAQIAVIIMNMDKGGMFFNNWKDAYKSFILSKKFLNYGDAQLGYGDLQDISFALLDFNADSIPELVIYNGFNGRNLASNYIFTYDRRVVCYCGTTMASAYTVKNYPGMFASVWLSGSYLDGENYKKYDEMTYLDYYSLSSGKVKKTQVLVTAKPKGSSSQTTVFKTADSALYSASQRQQVYYTAMHYKDISASWSSFVNTF